jgi:hypothetical protein
MLFLDIQHIVTYVDVEFRRQFEGVEVSCSRR